MSLELKHVRLSQSGTYNYHYKDTEHDVRGPRLEQSESAVQITKGKKLKISYTAVYSEASYVDRFWFFKKSRKQTNFKYEVNDARFRKCSEGTIKSRNISLTIYNAGLNDSGQYSCVLNTSHGLRLKNISIQVVADAIGKFLLSLYFTSGI